MKVKYYSLLMLIGLAIPFFGIAQNFKKIGYLPTYRFDLVDRIELERLTHVNISFANPDKSGKLQTNGVEIDDVVSLSHAAGLEVFIALAGGAADPKDWAKWITPEERSEFISGIVAYTLKHKLQGVDVDIEWSVVNEDYSGFVLELKDSLDVYNLTMSAALPGIYRYPEITDEALASFAWVNLMAYDLTGPWQPNNPGPHSPYSFALESIVYWKAQGLDEERTTLGVPFYGWDFTDQTEVKSTTFAKVVNEDPNNAFTDRLGDIFYNGIPTISRKTLLALNNQLSGIMIWEIGQDYFGEFSLLKHIDELIDLYETNSILKTEELANISLFPNPTTDIIKIQTALGKETTVSLVSAIGQLLEKKTTGVNPETMFQLKDYASGTYFVVIESADYQKAFRVIKL